MDGIKNTITTFINWDSPYWNIILIIPKSKLQIYKEREKNPGNYLNDTMNQEFQVRNINLRYEW